MLSALHLSPESTGSATSASNDSRRDDASSVATSMSAARSQLGFDDAPHHVEFRKGIFTSPILTAPSPSNSDYYDAPSKPNLGPQRELSRSPSPFRHAPYQPALGAVQASMDQHMANLAPSQSDQTQYRSAGVVAPAQRHAGGPSWSTSGSASFTNAQAPFGAGSLVPLAHEEQMLRGSATPPLRDARNEIAGDASRLQQRRSSLPRHPWAVGAASTYPVPPPRSPPPASGLPLPFSQDYTQPQQQPQQSNWLTSLGEEEIMSSDAGHSERKFTRASRLAESSEGSEEAAWPDDMSCVDAPPSLGNRSSNTHLGNASANVEREEAAAIAQQEMSVEPHAPVQAQVQVDATAAEAYEVAALRRQVEQLQMALKQRNSAQAQPQESTAPQRGSASYQPQQQQQRVSPARYQQPQLPLQYNPPQPAFETPSYMRYASGSNSSGLPTPMPSRTPSLAGGSRHLSQHSHAHLHQQHHNQPSLLDVYTSAASSPLTSHVSYSRSRASVPGSSAQSATFIDESASALARSQDVDELAKKIAALEFMFRASALEQQAGTALGHRGSSLDLVGLRRQDAQAAGADQLLQMQMQHQQLQQQQLHSVPSQQQLHTVPSQLHYGGVGPYTSQQPVYAPLYASQGVQLTSISAPHAISEPPYSIPARRASTILGSTASIAAPSPTGSHAIANGSSSTVDAIEAAPRPPSSRGRSPALSAYNFNATPYARDKTAFSTHSGDSSTSAAARDAGPKRKKGAKVAKFIMGVSSSKRSDGYGGAELGAGGVRMKQGSGRGVLRGTTETADKRLNRTPS